MKQIIPLALLIVVAVTATAASPGSATPGKSGPGRLMTPATSGDYTIFDVNNIRTVIRNNGSFDRDPGTGNAGYEWPKGSGKTAIYASGLWLGGKSNADGVVRVAVAEYSYEYDAGPILPGGGWADPSDPRYRMYKVRRGDTYDTNPDFANWPGGDGAPYVDVNGNGYFEPPQPDGSGDRPLVPGDMTVWSVFNEADPSVHINMNAPPLGVEVQMTASAFNRSDALGNVIFYRWKLINKGGRNLDSTFVTLWSDPDLGDAGDDYDGCDTTLGLGYVYNGQEVDGVYGIPPAVGFDFLQGPLVPGAPTDTARFPDGREFPGMRLLKMTSFIKYNNDASDMGNPNTGQEVFNYQKGLTRSGQLILNPAGNPSTFMFPGDPSLPASTTNWIETDPPGDRRFMMNAGPFTFAVGDTQEIVAATMIALAAGNRASVAALKEADDVVQRTYEMNAALMSCSPESLSGWTGEWDSTAAMLAIYNLGGTSLDWTITTDPAGTNALSWLSVNPSSGTVVPGGETAVSVTMRAVEPGGTIQQGFLTISSSDTMAGPRTVPVQLFVVRILNVGIETGWNILSVPLTMDDYSKFILFPSAMTPGFRYQPGSGYVGEYVLSNRRGYWLSFPAAEDVLLAGFPIDADTFSVEAGWNLIGSISGPVPVDSIGSIPGGLVTGEFYTYAPMGYQAANTIIPGRGYWVKVSQAGSLVLRSIPPPMQKITILTTGEMPPAPPGGILTEKEEDGSREFALVQNHPNPFNPTTSIRYMLPGRSLVVLDIYNILGQKVRSLVSEEQAAGGHLVNWDATNDAGRPIATGVYFYRLEARTADHRDYTMVKKMLLLR